jgi:hypothetical protein
MAHALKTYGGSTGWVSHAEQHIPHLKKVIFKTDNDIVIDAIDNDVLYTTTLTCIASDQFKGSFKTNQTPPNSGHVSCRLFRSGDEIFLFGTWHEDGEACTWWLTGTPEILK